jgi:hypothetical protein
MADMVNFCNENNVNIWYNTITRPVDQAIWNLPYTKLKEIYETLSSAKLIPNKSTDRNIYQYNVSTYKNLVEQQIKTWMIEAGEREKSFSNNIKPAANIKAEFETAWLSFLNDKYPDENQRISISKKLTDLKNELADETPEETFYKIVSSSTLEILVSNLESYDLGKLKERFRGAVKSA